jgi:hypothetical protein
MLEDKRREGLRRQGGIAAGEIRKADDPDAPGFTRRIADKSLRLGDRVVAIQHDLRRMKELTVPDGVSQVVAQDMLPVKADGLCRLGTRVLPAKRGAFLPSCLKGPA